MKQRTSDEEQRDECKNERSEKWLGGVGCESDKAGGVMRLDCATPRPAKPREAQLAWWCWLNKVRRLR